MHARVRSQVSNSWWSRLPAFCFSVRLSKPSCFQLGSMHEIRARARVTFSPTRCFLAIDDARPKLMTVAVRKLRNSQEFLKNFSEVPVRIPTCPAVNNVCLAATKQAMHEFWSEHLRFFRRAFSKQFPRSCMHALVVWQHPVMWQPSVR